MPAVRDHPYGGVPRLPEGPLEIGALAGGGGPYELEIGFGRADFLIERARQRPEARIVGVETRLKWVGLAADKAKARGIELCFAEMKDPVMDKLRRFGLFDEFGEKRFFPTIDSAVSDYVRSNKLTWNDLA